MDKGQVVNRWIKSRYVRIDGSFTVVNSTECFLYL